MNETLTAESQAPPRALDRRNLKAIHPFARLDRLLDGIPPGASGIALDGHPADAPVMLQVGEPRNRPPDFVAEELAAAAAGWSRYPPPRATPAYLGACAAWLEQRYGLASGLINPATMILPLPGTREGLFFAALASSAPPEGSPGGPPGGAVEKSAILIPNPGYHVYAGGAAGAAAEAIFVAATHETGFLPDYRALDPALLDRVDLAYFCSPSNPQGAVADLDRLGGLIQLARRHDFTLAFDECYAEIYNDAAPPGALQAAALAPGQDKWLDNLLVFHSLSKRSSAPGLRCGFVVGDPRRIEALDMILRMGGAGVPLPVLAAGARLWREEAHVAANRARYRENFALAERVLGRRFGFAKPAGGFFLWLEVGDGEAAARKLWREAGIRVLPGSYMCHTDAQGTNPGAGYIRVALVYDAGFTEAALRRLAEIL